MNKIILALDTTNLEDALNIAKKVKDKIFTVKLVLEFFNANGKDGVKKFNDIVSIGKIFSKEYHLDKKYGYVVVRLNKHSAKWFSTKKLALDNFKESVK